MAKNKILGWLGAIQGIRDIAGIALYSLRKTSMDALKALAENKALLEQPKELQSNAKDVGLEAIRNRKLQAQEAFKKTEGQQKSDEAYVGIFSKPPVRKPGSKQ
ncbi:hypothetical protein KR038_002036 [Drosophila bunnanda]|nr:hypothetical protein KR038_002036 [Drosophila bunnanda]